MAAILSSIASNLLEMIILAAVAVAGVVCGHKFRTRRDAQKSGSAQKQDEK